MIQFPMPTEQEIQDVIHYLEIDNEKNGYNHYIKPLINKHGEKWVDQLVSTVVIYVACNRGRR